MRCIACISPKRKREGERKDEESDGDSFSSGGLLPDGFRFHDLSGSGEERLYLYRDHQRGESGKLKYGGRHIHIRGRRRGLCHQSGGRREAGEDYGADGSQPCPFPEQRRVPGGGQQVLCQGHPHGRP